MKLKFLLPVSVFALLAFSRPGNTSSIQKHWVCTSAADSLLVPEDLWHHSTVKFKAVKYTDKIYQSGGGAYTGMEFSPDGTFRFYNNVLCSSESSPVSGTGTWINESENILKITCNEKSFYLKILQCKKATLTARFTHEKTKL